MAPNGWFILWINVHHTRKPCDQFSNWSLHGTLLVGFQKPICFNKPMWFSINMAPERMGLIPRSHELDFQINLKRNLWLARNLKSCPMTFNNGNKHCFPKRHLSYVLFTFKAPFEKIKQVSSTKLTNWYKNICHWNFSSTYHNRCEPKVSKILLPKFGSIQKKNETRLSQNSILQKT